MRRIAGTCVTVVLAVSVSTAALGQDEKETATNAQSFSDALSSGGQGPEMVVIQAGSFLMAACRVRSVTGTNCLFTK